MHSGLTPETASDRPDETEKIERRALRERLLAAREALSPAACEQHSAAIRAHLQDAFPQLATQRVAFCWPIRNEPDLRPLMQHWLSGNMGHFQALLPVVHGPASPLAFRAWTPDSRLQPDRYGIPMPVDGEFTSPEALLIPVNGFDAQGYRLGYGGGFFDRTLAALHPRPLTIGVGFELCRVATIRPQAHDMRLDAVVTEAGVFRTGESVAVGADSAATSRKRCSSDA